MFALSVGITSILSTLYCTFMNTSQFILRRQSKVKRKSCLSRSAQNLSHAAILFLSLVPIFICLSYFLPSIQLQSNQTYCLCKLWFVCAVLSYSIGVYMVKAMYFVNMLLVNSKLKTEQKRTKIIIGFMFVGITGIIIIIVQPIILEATCHPAGMGCIISIPSYNGFGSCICVFFDAIIYCILLKDFIKLANNEAIQVNMSDVNGGNDDGYPETESRGKIEDGTTKDDSAKSSAATVISQLTDIGESEASIKSKNRRQQRVSITAPNQQHLIRISLFKDLTYHFMATVMAIVVTIIDLSVNVMFQDYNFLTLTVIDCCLMVTANFLGFRDARQYLTNLFKCGCLLGKPVKSVAQKNENQSQPMPKCNNNQQKYQFEDDSFNNINF